MREQTLARIRAAIEKLPKTTTPILIAIDGRCAAGKTTLAAKLQEALDCNVFHMDDFFLPPALRTPERLAQPGGNVEYERVYDEVLLPVMHSKAFSYRPYSCRLKRQTTPVSVLPKPINIVEGAYSCHPHLWDCYDLRIFLDISPSEQLRRIGARNGKEQLAIFQEQWIPLEERYFSAFQIRERCNLSFSHAE